MIVSLSRPAAQALQLPPPTLAGRVSKLEISIRSHAHLTDSEPINRNLDQE